MIGEDHEPALPPAGATRADGFAGWLREGWRSALGCRVRWENLRAGPAFVLALIAAGVILDVALQRLLIEGPARFWWYGLGDGWWFGLALLWVCWVVAASPPGAATVFALLQVQWLVIGLATGVVSVMATRSQALAAGPVQAWILWAVWWATLIWWIGAALLVLWRAAEARAPARRVAVVALIAIAAAQLYAPAARYWYPDRDDSAAEAPEAPRLTQEILEAQPGLLDTQLRGLAPQRAGVIDLYAITFAPYAGEDVFRRESELVSAVVGDRFDAGGRTLQLVNNERTMQSLAWATPLNLRRAIDGIAARMDRDEDVLLIHLTSHGARDGQLASGSWPPFMRDAVMPADLRAWLDAAAIRWRVVSVSACYSGSWIAPLTAAETLVMTASDAEHTSYGCGRRSDLTYFGRAMYDEQLRTQTLSFEKALAAARPVIEQREREAGKEDGYSNPQIAVGDAIRERLRQLEARLESTASR